MGNNLVRWAGRLSGLYNLNPLAQCVLLRMANAAVDPDAQGDTPKSRRCVCFLPREELAQQIYGDRRKSRYLDRAIAELRKTGLIVPEGISARKGHVQEYRLGIYEAVSLRYEALRERYPNDTQELVRINLDMYRRTKGHT